MPRKHERVGFRADLGVECIFPREIHSEESLLRTKWIDGDYWERHEIAKKNLPPLDRRRLPSVGRLRRGTLFGDELAPWLTVRDAIAGLTNPERFPTNTVANHRFNPGSRSYPDHTGSPLDEPAKTLKSGDHGVPGRENMLTRVDGSMRYFTVREAARLEILPDDYQFSGPWSEAMRQLGNAVTVLLAETVARSVAHTLIAKAPRS